MLSLSSFHQPLLSCSRVIFFFLLLFHCVFQVLITFQALGSKLIRHSGTKQENWFFITWPNQVWFFLFWTVLFRTEKALTFKKKRWRFMSPAKEKQMSRAMSRARRGVCLSLWLRPPFTQDSWNDSPGFLGYCLRIILHRALSLSGSMQFWMINHMVTFIYTASWSSARHTKSGGWKTRALNPSIPPWAMGPGNFLTSQNLSFPVCKIDMDPALSLCKFVMRNKWHTGLKSTWSALH